MMARLVKMLQRLQFLASATFVLIAHLVHLDRQGMLDVKERLAMQEPPECLRVRRLVGRLDQQAQQAHQAYRGLKVSEAHRAQQGNSQKDPDQ